MEKFAVVGLMSSKGEQLKLIFLPNQILRLRRFTCLSIQGANTADNIVFMEKFAAVGLMSSKDEQLKLIFLPDQILRLRKIYSY